MTIGKPYTGGDTKNNNGLENSNAKGHILIGDNQ